MASKVNIVMDQGATFNTTYTFFDQSNSAIDFTTYTAASQMRKSYQSSTAYAFTASVYDASNGKIRLQLTDTASAAIPAGRWLYDVEITSSGGTKTRVVEGIVTVNAQITQI